MDNWLTIKDLSQYLQISELKIRYLIKNKQIPSCDNHGFLRFNRQEIDEWMKSPVSAKKEISSQIVDDIKEFTYRGKPIKSYALTAHKILIGRAPWHRLPGFIKSYVERVKEIKIHDNGRDYLLRKEFSLFSNNYNDYLRVSCQLGLIEKRKGTERQKEYSPTAYAMKIHTAKDQKEIQKIFIESIFDIVRNKRETVPDERHSILLLWLLLSLREKGIEPSERHFAKAETDLKTYVPLIRLNFAKSLCQFLFDNSRADEKKFLSEWMGLIGDSKRTVKKKEDKNRLTLFDV